MAGKQFFCKTCHCWIPLTDDVPAAEARKEHEEWCAQVEAMMTNFDAELEYYLGEA